MESGNKSKFRDKLLQSDLLTSNLKMLTTNRILSTLSSHSQTGGTTVDLRPSLKSQSSSVQVQGCDLGPLSNRKMLINRQLQKPPTTGTLTNKQLAANSLSMAGDSLTNKLLTTPKLTSLETALCFTVGGRGRLHPDHSLLPRTRDSFLDDHKSHLTRFATRGMQKSTSRAVKEQPARSMSRKYKENITTWQKHVKKRPNHEKIEDEIEMPTYEMLMSEFDDTFKGVADEFVLQNESLLKGVVGEPQQMKALLINAVSASLIRAPDFKKKDDMVRQHLLHLADRVTTFDGEFVLKLALYTRSELNIRTTANFLLAYAANRSVCRCYLQRYFKSSVRLPSDWIDVAVMYMTFHDKSMTAGALPAALRRAMVAKFVDFDKYQLAKYNKESSRKKKTEETKKKIVDESDDSSDDKSSDSVDSDEVAQLKVSRSSELRDVTPRMFTLKMLIRKLHISEPVEHVMCLIGKKYPNNYEEFSKSHLPGTYDEEQAGKRMKLPTPETWETQVSLHGNKASTWESLIDNHKLPFMAMLRNLRNMIKSGMSEKHHKWVLKKLTDEGAVTNSRQFPFRFFSAYAVLGEMEKDYKENQSNIITAAIEQSQQSTKTTQVYTPGGGQSHTRGGRGQGRGGRGQGRGGQGQGRGVKGQGDSGRGGRQCDNNETPQELAYDTRILTRYRKALDTAVMIATANNVQPIRGTTVVYCVVGSATNVNCMSAKGLGQPRTVAEVTLLLGLMFKYASEHSQVIICGDSGYQQVELESGTILENMEHMMEMQRILNKTKGNGGIPERHLLEFLTTRTQIDNLVVLSTGLSSSDATELTKFNSVFRQLINRDLLFVNVNVGGSLAVSQPDVTQGHENDVNISGFSDQILRFVAERGNQGLLTHVENIDVAYNLKPLPKQAGKENQQQETEAEIERTLAIASCAPRWRTLRVFISSTFRDMHGERDLLTRFVFPELRARCKKQFVNVVEIDMRWGMTEKDARSNRILELCLREAGHCHMFVGMLGERYGSIPSSHALPDTTEFDWVRAYPHGTSITELEMYLGALSKSSSAQDSAFFYIRDNTFMSDVPKQWKADFATENSNAAKRVVKLKEELRTSGLEVYDGYPCHWGGVVEGKPVVAGLELFGQRVLENLSSAISTQYPADVAALDDVSHESAQHDAFMASLLEYFTGRHLLLRQCLQTLSTMSEGVLVLSGRPGVGKSALMAAAVQGYKESTWCTSEANILVHFVGAEPTSTNVAALVRRLCHELVNRFCLSIQLAEDYKNLEPQFISVLRDAALHCNSPLVIFIDGLDLLSDDLEAHQLHWIPDSVPQNVILVLSCQSDTRCHQRLCHRDNTVHLKVGQLDQLEKSDVAREMLAVHRKRLDESPFNNQMKLLTSKREADSPLFLQVACEELRVFGVFEKVNEKLKTLPHTLPQLLQVVLARLEEDLGQNHLVATALSLLVSARSGLMEDDMHMMLSYNQLLDPQSPFSLQDVRNMNLGPNDKIPPAVMCQLISAIRGFLRPFTPDGTASLSVAHAVVHSAIWQRYLKPSGGKMEVRLHTLMAGYYYVAADWKRDETWRGHSPHAFRELPYHLASAGCFKDLETVLCSLSFIGAKCRLAMATDLLDDYQTTGVNHHGGSLAQKKFTSSERVQQYHGFVSRNVNILRNCPSLLWQLAINEPEDTAPARDVTQLLDTATLHASLMEQLNKPTLTNPCLLTLSDLTQAATCVALSADSQQLVCGSQDCSVRLYHTATGKEMHRFQGHSNEVTDVCFVGANRLCSASVDGTLSLWDTHIGHRVAVIKAHRRRVTACVTDRLAQVIASTSWDGTVKFWRARDGKAETDLPSRGCPVNCVSFHPDGQSVITGSWDAALCIWDVSLRKRKAVLRGHSSSVRSVSFSPSGEHVASASLDGEVKLWTAASGTQIGNLNCHTRPINSLTFSPSGDHLITVSDDQKVKIWSGRLGRKLRTLGGENTSPAHCLALHPGGEMVVVGYHDGKIRMFDCLTGVLWCELEVHAATINCIRFNKTGTHILTASHDNTAKIVKVKANSEGQSEVVSCLDHSAAVLSTAYGGEVIATTCEDSTAFLYLIQEKEEEEEELGLMHVFMEQVCQQQQDVCQQQQDVCQQQQDVCQQQQFSQPKNGFASPLAELVGHDDAVTACSFNANNTKLVTASRDRSIFVWDVPFSTWGRRNLRLQPTQVLRECHADWINDCVWSNTSNFILTGSNDCNMKIWDMKKEQEKACLTGHSSTVNSLAFSYGCVVSASSDSTVKVWSHQGTLITTLIGHKSRVNSCDLHVTVTTNQGFAENTTESSDWATMIEEDEWRSEHDKVKLDKTSVRVDNVIVASCCDDGQVHLWQPLQSDQLACLTGHSHRVVSVACSSNGIICTAALDCTVKVWQPHLATINDNIGHDAEVTSLAYSPGGAWAVSASRDCCIKLWNSSSDIQQDTADKVNQRDNVPSCQLTVKAHTKAVTAVCFIAAQTFVTGSDDASLSVWTISNIRQRPVIRKQHHRTATSPVTCLVHTPEGASGHGIVSSHWDGSVCVHNQSLQVIHTQNPHSDPILTSLYVPTPSNFAFITGSMDENIAFINWMKKTSTCQIRHNTAEDKGRPSKNWICCMAVDLGKDGTVYAGDSHGQMSRLENWQLVQTKKIHSAAVTSCVFSRDTLFTASFDGTIKIWTAQLRQIGQFHCTSAVMTMVATPSDHHQRLMCGDYLGNIIFLKWIN